MQPMDDNLEGEKEAPDKSALYAQACRDAHFITDRLRGLPWAEGRRVLLGKLEMAATELLE